MRFFYLLVFATISILPFVSCATSPRIDVENNYTVVRDREFYKILQLGKSTYVVMGKLFKEMGCNSAFVVGKSGVLVFDTHISKKAMRAVLTDIEEITGKKVVKVINSHFHGDHTQGNGAFSSNTEIIAHKLALPHYFADEKEKQGILDANIFRVAKTGIEKDLQLKDFGVRIIAIGPGHSVGDIVAYQETDQILLMGDLYVNGYIGFLKEGFLRQWVNALSKLGSLDSKVVIAGHGRLSDRSAMLDYRDYLEDFRQTTKSHFQTHQSPEGYRLPSKYDHLGARYYLEDNVARAFELWQNDQL